MKYSVITFGCRVNQADSLGFEEALLDAGAEAVAPERADLVVVNTCSVTASADQGARQAIRRVARDNPNARIVVTGCYATRRPAEVAALPQVSGVFANDDKPRLLPMLVARGLVGDRARMPEAGASELSTAQRFADGEGSCGARIEPGVAGRTAFTLRVQTGCAEPCAYCIIPSTRGRPRSIPIGDVLREVRRVTAAGFKEITLTGVHLGSYGRDLTPRSSLVDLLRTLGSDATTSTGPQYGMAPPRQAPSVCPLFRISSLEPMDCCPDIIDMVASSDRFAPHFHLPLQHASDRVLARMRRPYTIEYYANLVDSIRARIPSASIGSDIIVGFPGESGDDFEILALYLERSPLTHVHVFPYSDRPGTDAAAWGPKVPGAVVRERGRRVREIAQRLASCFRASQVGSVQRGLTLDDGALVVTGNYLKVRIPRGRPRNEWVNVRVTGVSESGMVTGEVR